DRAERRPVAAGRETARVAVRQDAGPVREQLDRVRAPRRAPLDLVRGDALGALARRIVAHRVEGPAEIDGGRPRREERLVRLVQRFPPGPRARETGGGGGAGPG